MGEKNMGRIKNQWPNNLRILGVCCCTWNSAITGFKIRAQMWGLLLRCLFFSLRALTFAEHPMQTSDALSLSLSFSPDLSLHNFLKHIKNKYLMQIACFANKCFASFNWLSPLFSTVISSSCCQRVILAARGKWWVCRCPRGYKRVCL